MLNGSLFSPPMLTGVEPLHVHPSDPHAAPSSHGAHAGHDLAPVPPGHQQHAGLRAAARPALHRRHRGDPGVPGRAHGGHQTSRSPHGPQPAGLCIAS